MYSRAAAADGAEQPLQEHLGEARDEHTLAHAGRGERLMSGRTPRFVLALGALAAVAALASPGSSAFLRPRRSGPAVAGGAVAEKFSLGGFVNHLWDSIAGKQDDQDDQDQTDGQPEKNPISSILDALGGGGSDGDSSDSDPLSKVMAVGDMPEACHKFKGLIGDMLKHQGGRRLEAKQKSDDIPKDCEEWVNKIKDGASGMTDSVVNSLGNLIGGGGSLDSLKDILPEGGLPEDCLELASSLGELMEMKENVMSGCDAFKKLPKNCQEWLTEERKKADDAGSAASGLVEDFFGNLFGAGGGQ